MIIYKNEYMIYFATFTGQNRRDSKFLGLKDSRCVVIIDDASNELFPGYVVEPIAQISSSSLLISAACAATIKIANRDGDEVVIISLQ